MLYLTTAWETTERIGDPAVLYCGTDADKAMHAVMDAPANFVRVEHAQIHFSIPMHLPEVRKPALMECRAPSIGEALAMLDRIKDLEAKLAEARTQNSPIIAPPPEEVPSSPPVTDSTSAPGAPEDDDDDETQGGPQLDIAGNPPAVRTRRPR